MIFASFAAARTMLLVVFNSAHRSFPSELLHNTPRAKLAPSCQLVHFPFPSLFSHQIFNSLTSQLLNALSRQRINSSTSQLQSNKIIKQVDELTRKQARTAKKTEQVDMKSTGAALRRGGGGYSTV